MQEIKLVLTDMDGTIVMPGRHEVSERVRNTIVSLEESGIVVAAVTGRPYGMAREALKVLGIEGPCVFDAGASEQDAKSGELLWSKWLDVGTLREISEVLLPGCLSFDAYPDYDEHNPAENELDLVVRNAPYAFALVPNTRLAEVEERLACIQTINVQAHPSFDYPDTYTGVQVTHAEATKYHGVNALRELIVH